MSELKVIPHRKLLSCVAGFEIIFIRNLTEKKLQEPPQTSGKILEVASLVHVANASQSCC